jgi:hypothetical protein
MAENSKYILNSISVIGDGVLKPNQFVGYDNKITDGAGEAVLGIAHYNNANYASGETVTVVTHGIYDVICGGNVAAGEPVTTDTAGKAVKAALLTATVPTGATPVTSTSATPAMTVAGGQVPSTIVGWCVIGGSSGDLISIKLV